MNKSNNEVFLKKNIVMYAKKVRDIQREQIDPYIDLIEKNLSELYPSLVNRNDGVENWTCDIVNTNSNLEVMDTLDRIESILNNDIKNKWVCCVCGENTYDVDCDYLSGVDHLSCLMTEELKSNDSDSTNRQLNDVKNQLKNLQSYIKQLEQQISELEGK